MIRVRARTSLSTARHDTLLRCPPPSPTPRQESRAGGTMAGELKSFENLVICGEHLERRLTRAVGSRGPVALSWREAAVALEAIKDCLRRRKARGKEKS